ncbi:MAG: fibronectin type III domain-containing protein [Eubacterium sp.]|nr:fibronectin type III domain-containing protein [Eubacterium sp.]
MFSERIPKMNRAAFTAAATVFTVVLAALAVLAAALAVILAGAAVAYAESSAQGGTVHSNSVADAEDALGKENASVSISGSTLTITLSDDVVLGRPLRFVKGAAGDRVVLDLDGHSLTGAAGVDGTDEEAASGKHAVEIAADEFDVEIKGPGSVTGGKGAVYEFENGYRKGSRGGSAVFFGPRADTDYDESSATDLGYDPETLKYGLSVTGGAELTGGQGADVDYDDWLNNVNRIGTDCEIMSGKGGDGIGQVYTSDHILDVIRERSYAEVNIANGTIKGGAGGNVFLDDHPFTYAALAKIPAIKKAIEGLTGTEPYSNAADPDIRPADGGSGISFYSGRKYIEVGKNSTVQGGAGGICDHGLQGSLVNRIRVTGGDGGSGIEQCGDTGITNDYPENNAEAADDRYTGIRVFGKVRGGDTADADALYESVGEAGNGIMVYYYERYSGASYDYPRYDLYDGGYAGMSHFDSAWGTVRVESGGSVEGGDGGDAPCGAAGAGGSGIEDEGLSWSTRSLLCIVSDGIVAGGNGGDSGSMDVTTAGTVPCFSCGSGGNGIRMLDEGTVVRGKGTVKTGKTGDVTYRGDFDNGPYDRDHYDGVKKDSKGRLTYGGYPCNSDALYEVADADVDAGLTVVDGDYAMVRTEKASGLSASVTMTPFTLTKGPSTDTELSCSYTVPSGYKGKVFVRWCAKFGTITVEPGKFDFDKDYNKTKKITYDTTAEHANGEYDIEGAGTKYMTFSLLGNKSYPNCKTGTYGYRMEDATVERLAERVKYNDNNPTYIYCYVMLEDGRIAKSNMIWFTRTKKSGTGWSGSGRSSEEGGSSGDIKPSGTKIKTVKAAKKAFTVKWRKQASKVSGKRITGYQIQYSTKKNFRSGSKKVTVKGYKKVSRKVSGLRSGKKYYVRVRTYLKSGGKTYYSSWSPSKAVKTK